MGINVGAGAISTVMVGSVEAVAVYVGSTEVWSAVPTVTTGPRLPAEGFHHPRRPATGQSPRGIWSDGTTLWVVDIPTTIMAEAYNLVHARHVDAAKDFDIGQLATPSRWVCGPTRQQCGTSTAG